MDFNLTKQQQDICDLIREIAEKKLNNDVFNDDENEKFPKDKWKQICESGILGIAVDENYGGLGESITSMALAIKTLAAHCMDEGLVFSVCAHFCTCLIPIFLFGNQEQKNRYLVKLVTGELIGGNGSTEASAGSDLSLMETTITKSNNEYILNGSKIFVTNAELSDVLIIYAKSMESAKNMNLSAFIVDMNNSGMKLGQKWHKMGLRTSPISEVLLQNCVLSKGELLGREGFGLVYFNQSMIWERIIMAAYHIGAMELQYNNVFKYANNRSQFGSKIIKFGEISDKIVKMRTNIEAAKLLLYNTCWKHENGTLNTADASMLKLFTSESKVQNSLDAVQIFGGYGFMKEFLVEKQLRDSIGAKLYSGTSQIQKRLIIEGIGEINE